MVQETPQASPSDGPATGHGTVNTVSRRALLKAGWVAPVVLTLPLSGWCYEDHVSTSACDALKDEVHDEFEDAFDDIDWDNPDWSKVDWSEIDWTKVKQLIDCSKINWSQIDWNQIDCSKIDWSTFCDIDWRTIDCSRIRFDKLHVNWSSVSWWRFDWQRCSPVPSSVKWSWLNKFWSSKFHF